VNQASWRRVKDIFVDASERPEPERTQWVRQAAHGDAEIENEVLRLLRLDDGAEERLDELKPPAEMTRYAIEQHAFCAGDVLAGRYEIRRFLAFGGMGEVYEAEDLELGRRIAIKTIRGELAPEDHLHWMKREVQAARRVQHPNVCRVFDVVETQTATRESVVFLTMELLEGETLSEKLRREGPLIERQALPLIRQMVAALSAAHQAGVVHRDFKSGNVMILPRKGAAPRVMITDFGLARQIPSDRQVTTKQSTGSRGGYGTPAYMAPEQILSGKVGPAADIYALGVVLYEMLTGALPFAEDSPLAMAVKKTRERPVAPEKLATALRPTWSAAILKCLEADPKRRFGNLREILTHLETRSRQHLWFKLLRRRHAGKFKLAAGAVGLAGIAAFAWWLLPPEPRSEAVVDWERGVFDLQAGEPVQAARRLERALAQHRLPAVAHAYLALAWHEAGFVDKSRAELNRALYKPLQPETDTRFEQAVKLQLAGQREQALALLDQRPADLALLEDQLGKPEAEAHWKQVVVKAPNHPAAHLRLAMSYAKKGRWKEADREFILAQTYFQAADDPEMVRTISARRGIARVHNGDAGLVRQDIPSLSGFVALPVGSGYGPCERKVTLMAGEADNFALPYDPIPYVNPDFAANPHWPGNGRLKQFDEPRDDEFLFVSLIFPPLHFCGAQMEFRIRKGRSGYENDGIWWGSAPKPDLGQGLWRPAEDDVRMWTRDMLPEVLLDVQRAQVGKKVTSLDVIVSQHTTVDYIRLTLVY
jgi:tetratricopeptide (TPR) repeat protein